MRKYFALSLMFLFISPSHAATPDQCDAVRNEIAGRLDQAFRVMTEPIKSKIDRLQKNGLDPAHWYDPNLDKWVDHYAAMNEAAALRNQALVRLENEFIPHDCDDSQLAQNIVSVATVLVLPIAAIFPKHFGIDANAILQDGKIFGGDGAVIPTVRDKILDTLHIGGTVSDAVKDPIKTIITQPICALFRC
jgi:hypothetical protein